MSIRVTLVVGLLLVAFVPGPARADRVHLSGGAVLEGKVSQVGDKVLVEVEAGTLSVDAHSVLRIERATSSVETFLARRAALAGGDVAGRLALADYCRAHEMFTRERELLREVIAMQPDHAQARARLGYVRVDHGWLTRDEQLAAQGLIKLAGVWLSPEQASRLREAELERQNAEIERQKAEAELQAKRAELHAERERAERLARERAAVEGAVPAYGYRYYAYPGRGPVYSAPRPAPSVPPNYPINGVRPPQSYFP